MSWSTYWCGSQIAVLSLSYHRHLLPRSAYNQLIFMLPTGALWKAVMTVIIPRANGVTVRSSDTHRGTTQAHIAPPPCAQTSRCTHTNTCKHINALSLKHTDILRRLVRVEKYRKSQQTADSEGKRLAPVWKRNCLCVVNFTNIKYTHRAIFSREDDIYIIYLLTQGSNWNMCFFRSRQLLVFLLLY